MLLGRLATIGALVAVTGLATPAVASAGPNMTVGVVEDDVRASSLVEAETRMQILRVSGFRAVRVTSLWRPGVSRPDDAELATLANVAAAARRNGIRVFVTVMHPGSRTTPHTEEARAQFASYAATIVREIPTLRDVIVANEPNLNRFWLPQFLPDGSSAAPSAYLALLAATYDAVKAVSPSVRVHGGAVSPRGTDRPDGVRPTHSPTAFIRALGAAYRASGRTAPIMDSFVIHVYGDHSSQPPSTPHPASTTIGIADYDKLVALLGEAFDGTAQRGSTLPILYGEYGVETAIPAEKAALYTGAEPPRTRPASEETQAAFYEEALGLAFCQPNVHGLLIFLARDERALEGWQSGVYYVDGTPKTSLLRVSSALERTVGGSIARCPGLELTVQPTLLRLGTSSEARRGRFRVTLRCNLDCDYHVVLERVPGGAVVAARRGSASVGETVEVRLRGRVLPPGRYRYAVTLIHPVNPGPATLRRGPVWRVP
ncbi:MAG: hypothetical protein RMM28_05590 [Thermoleophilia bacterium]|nr:hypothetical protein [Gaiellaceae bacterium]MDW8338593.1 hypothetical protein [Thermoleophilia bacterium]